MTTLTTPPPTHPNSSVAGRGVGDAVDYKLAFAEQAVLTALDTANRRLLRKRGRAARHHSNGLRRLDPLRWHTVISTQGVDVDELLDGALRLFDLTAAQLDPVDAECIRTAISVYLRIVLASGKEYERDQLAACIHKAGCLPDAA